jgi:hypothetical protein
MRNRLRVQLISLLLCLSVAAGVRAQNASSSKKEPEEPDFAFISGSAYPQGKNSMQFIHQTAYGTRRFSEPGGNQRNDDELLFFQRVEYGITDRWEVDFVLPAAGSRTRLNGRTIASDYALADGLVGLRYRFLSEGEAPVTLTMGPQVIFPSGSVRRGTGSGSTGFAWDLAVSKDWGGPVFLYNTFNYHALPWAADTTPGSTQRFLLNGVDWATAIGIRALERPVRGNKHDIHAFLEGAARWEQEVEPGAVVGERRGKLSWIFSPGIRYGYITSRKTLVEIGVAAPIGIGPNGPKRSIIIQFQYEIYFTQPTNE